MTVADLVCELLKLDLTRPVFVHDGGETFFEADSARETRVTVTVRADSEELDVVVIE